MIWLLSTIFYKKLVILTHFVLLDMLKSHFYQDFERQLKLCTWQEDTDSIFKIWFIPISLFLGRDS